jgi:excisionase family DNA binding protein
MPGDGVTVPASLCPVLARLAVLGLMEQVQRDGGLPPAHGLAALLTALSASGRVSETVVSLSAPFNTSREAASLLGLSCREVRRLAANGRLIAKRPGRDWQIDTESILNYAKERRAA